MAWHGIAWETDSLHKGRLDATGWADATDEETGTRIFRYPRLEQRME